MKRVNPLPTDFHFYLLITIIILAGFILLNRSQKIKIPVCKNCNIVVIDIDSLRADALNCEKDYDNTPNLCAFINKANVFENNISQSDLTRPSFTSTLTSLYPSSHNIWNELFTELDDELLTLPELLQGQGYKTALYGFTEFNQLIYRGFGEIINVHDIFKDEFTPDKFLSELDYQGKPFILYIYLNDLHFPYLPFNNERLANEHPVPKGIPRTRAEYDEIFKDYLAAHYSEIFTQEAIDSNPDVFQGEPIKKRDEIFNLYVEYNMNRATLALYLQDAWKPYSEAFFKYVDLDNPSHILYLKSNYLAMLGLIDSKLGGLLDVLDSSQFSDNTIVVIRSNKADGFREYSYNLFTRNLYQELIHTPLIIKIPQVRPSVIKGLTQDVDIMPTLLGVVGIDTPAQAQGKSLVSLLGNPKASVNGFQIAQKGATDYVSTFRKGDWKLIMKELQPIELYNLTKDPKETTNLINIEEEKAMRLLDEYNRVIDSLPVYGDLDSPFPDWIDEEKRERLKEEGYF